MKYALVTGGSRGIGKAVALRLASAGWPVVINFLSNKEAAQAVADEITANGGIRRDGALFMMSDSDWHSVLDTTLNGYFYITRHLLKHMMPRKRGGRIINMASLSGVKGLPGQANYSAAKAAIIGATKSLAQEVGARNITVNAVAPGFIDTDMTKDLPVDDLKKMIPAARFGKPEEVAALVAFLASDEAGYITGEVININGGLYT